MPQASIWYLLFCYLPAGGWFGNLISFAEHFVVQKLFDFMDKHNFRFYLADLSEITPGNFCSSNIKSARTIEVTASIITGTLKAIQTS